MTNKRMKPENTDSSEVGGSRPLDAPTYEIYTFNDLLKIPISRLPVCLEELKKMIITSKTIYDLHNLLGKLKDDNIIQLPLKWIDDDKGNLNFKINTEINSKAY